MSILSSHQHHRSCCDTFHILPSSLHLSSPCLSLLQVSVPLLCPMPGILVNRLRTRNTHTYHSQNCCFLFWPDLLQLQTEAWLAFSVLLSQLSLSFTAANYLWAISHQGIQLLSAEQKIFILPWCSAYALTICHYSHHLSVWLACVPCPVLSSFFSFLQQCWECSLQLPPYEFRARWKYGSYLYWPCIQGTISEPTTQCFGFVTLPYQLGWAPWTQSNHFIWISAALLLQTKAVYC